MIIPYQEGETHTHTTLTYRCTHTHIRTHAHTHIRTHAHTQTCTQKKSKVFHCRLMVTPECPCTKWASEPVQCNLLEPGLGTRRWTDRTSSARGVGTRSPTWATADMRELPVTLPPRNKFPGTHSQLSQLVGWC